MDLVARREVIRAEETSCYGQAVRTGQLSAVWLAFFGLARLILVVFALPFQKHCFVLVLRSCTQMGC